MNKPLNGTLVKSNQDIIMGLDKEAIVYYKERYENAKVAYHNWNGVQRDNTYYLIWQL